MTCHIKCHVAWCYCSNRQERRKKKEKGGEHVRGTCPHLNIYLLFSVPPSFDTPLLSFISSFYFFLTTTLKILSSLPFSTTIPHLFSLHQPPYIIKLTFIILLSFLLYSTSFYSKSYFLKTSKSCDFNLMSEGTIQSLSSNYYWGFKVTLWLNN